jgi:hypothetical protein
MNKISILFSIIILLSSCNKEKLFTGSNYINDDFESVSDASELLSSENWTFYQQTEMASSMQLDTILKVSGNKCLKFIAAKGDVSKSDIANNELAFFEGETIKFSGWFYLNDSLTLDYIFLIDIEEKVAIGASPGIRIAVNDEGYLVVDRSKFGEKTIMQTVGKEVKFPRNEWVNIEFEILLHKKKKGKIRLWQNGVSLIDVNNIQTLPKDKLFFTQGTKGMYQSLQVGITAVTTDHDVVLYIDNIILEKIN